MAARRRPRFGTRSRVIADVFAHPPMRRLQIASASWSAGEAAYLVAIFIYAYGIGGPAGVATIALLRTLPSVVLAPVVTRVAGGVAADTLLRGILVIRAASVALTAVLLASEATVILIYGLAAVDAVAATLLRPIRGSLLPAIARTPEELVAGNVALTTGDSLANLVGPALAAGSLLLGGGAAPFLPGIAMLGVALAAGFGVRGANPLMTRRPAVATDRGGWHGSIESVSPALPVIGAFTIQRFVRGALTVLLVAAAIDLLAMGEAGVGLLTAAVGLGGLVGGGVSVGLIGRQRLTPWFVLGIAIWSAGIALIGAVPVAGAALVFLAVGGIGKIMIDVAGYTLLQRSVPNTARTQVLGFQEGLVTAALALGAVVASALIDLVGIRGALILAGTVPVALVATAWPLLRHVEVHTRSHDAELRLLDGIGLFRPLQLATKEELAAELEHVTAAAGEAIVTQGEPGDRFYVIESGELSVEIDGRSTGRLRAGDAFGEIALLRDVPRTATVRALTEVRLAVLDRSTFLAAVTGHRESAVAAERLVVERLGG